MIPALISMFADITRTFLFPVTMLFGPFLTKIGEYCTSVHQEIEADVEDKQNEPQAAECSLTSRPETNNSSWALARQIMGSSHPVNDVRIEKLKSELVRWELENRVAEKKRIMGEPERSSILGLV
ncbi:hypothetical protein DFH29DRAFT_956434 [Suillus ampliporus]|nr:hypothetical protein DFH29DRAFT_956434 [Suillus ampliporus]